MRAFSCLPRFFAWAFFLSLASAASAQTVVPLLTDSAPFTIVPQVYDASLSHNSSGDTVVVWNNEDGVSGRVWNPDGTVRTEITGPRETNFPNLGDPSVSIAGDGGLVVGWVETILVFPPAEVRLFYQRFGPLGQALGDPVQALDFLGWGIPGLTAVGQLDGGEVAVYGDTGAEGEYGSARRVFDSSDEPMGDAQLLGPTEEDRLPYAIRRAVAPNGESLVVWGSFRSAFSQAWEAYRIEGRFFDAQGEPQGAAFEIADPAAGFGVAWHPTGGFLVAWNQPTNDVIRTGEPSPFSVRGRMVSSEGLGPEQVIKAEEDGLLYRDPFHLWALAVAVDEDGRGLVLWSQETADSGGDLEIFGQELTADLTLVRPRFELQGPASGSSYLPLAAPMAPGKFLLAWHQWPAGSSGPALQGQLLRLKPDAADLGEALDLGAKRERLP